MPPQVHFRVSFVKINMTDCISVTVFRKRREKVWGKLWEREEEGKEITKGALQAIEPRRKMPKSKVDYCYYPFTPPFPHYHLLPYTLSIKFLFCFPFSFFLSTSPSWVAINHFSFIYIGKNFFSFIRRSFIGPFRQKIILWMLTDDYTFYLKNFCSH